MSEEHNSPALSSSYGFLSSTTDDENLPASPSPLSFLPSLTAASFSSSTDDTACFLSPLLPDEGVFLDVGSPYSFTASSSRLDSPVSTLPSSSHSSSSPSPPPLSLSDVALHSVAADSTAREERAIRRKQLHQRLDMKRRQREASAVQRLHQLSQLPLVNSMHSQPQPEQQEGTANEVSAPTRAAAGSPAKAGAATSTIEGRRTSSVGVRGGGSGEDDRPVKVRVLESAVERMERLIQRFHQQCTHIEAKDRHIAALQQQLQHIGAAAANSPPVPAVRGSSYLSPATFSFLAHLDRSVALSAFIRPLISILLIRLPDFTVVDANLQHQTETGWPTTAITNKSLSWSCSSTRQPTHDMSHMCPLVKRVEPLATTGSGAGLRVRRVHQYPGSGRSLKELVAGRKQRAEMLWRFYRPDGCLMETPCTAWLAAREGRDEASGEVTLAPAGFVFLAAETADVVKVDEWQAADGDSGVSAGLKLPHLRAKWKCKCLVGSGGLGVDTQIIA